MAESEKTPAAAKSKGKGGRKGGTIFPRINLEQALEYADKLVSKTHTGPQTESTILAGVMGNSGPEGQVRVSALKQYGLLEGDRTAYQATKLAKSIDAAVPGGKPALLHQALLNSKIFSQLFQTFHGDTVSRAKIRQRAQALKAHPDFADECVAIFMESAQTAGLGKINGDDITLVQAGAAPAAGAPAAETEDPEAGEETGLEDGGDEFATPAAEKNGTGGAATGGAGTSKPAVVLNLNVDPSSDPDKLKKQLELLRQFKLI